MSKLLNQIRIVYQVHLQNMLKIKSQNLKSLSHKNFSQVELTFNSNDDLNILLGENSKNVDKLNEIIDVEISFFWK